MVNLPIVQQPIPFNVQAQLPVESIRVDNQQVPPIPQPSQLFESAANRKSDNAKNPNIQNTQNNNSSQPLQNQGIEAKDGTEDNSDDPSQSSQQRTKSQKDLQQQQQIQAEISQLAQRDRQVKAHESAHSSVGGQFTGSPQFTFKKGPDGVLYAVSGEVSISTSEIPNDPEATLAKLDTVIRAALAPADPSAQDLRVASRAASSIIRIRAELAAANPQQQDGKNNSEPQSSILIPQDTFKQILQSRLEKSGALSANDVLSPQLQFTA